MKRTETDYSGRALLEKLAVRREHRVAAIGVNDAAFLAELKRHLANSPSRTLMGRYDIIFVKVDRGGNLGRIARAASHLQPDGALWVFHPKGKGASPSDAEVRSAGIAAGLVDNKISAYTQTHTATRYVIPVVNRKRVTKRKDDVEPEFAPVARALLHHRDVTGGRLMSAYGLRVNGKIFAMFPRGRFVVKLPKDRVDELVESGQGERFRAGKRVMREWVAVKPSRDWIALAREAYAFVKSAAT